jgi:hypothetical protein
VKYFACGNGLEISHLKREIGGFAKLQLKVILEVAYRRLESQFLGKIPWKCPSMLGFTLLRRSDF